MNARRLFEGLFLVFGLTAATLRAGPSSGGDFSLEGGLVSGGASSEGGEFTVEADDDPTSGFALSGGDFRIEGSLVGVAVIPGEVPLSLTAIGNQATLTWPDSATDYVLEFTADIGNLVDWRPVVPVPVGNAYTTTFNQPLRFFRLRKP